MMSMIGNSLNRFQEAVLLNIEQFADLKDHLDHFLDIVVIICKRGGHIHVDEVLAY